MKKKKFKTSCSNESLLNPLQEGLQNVITSWSCVLWAIYAWEYIYTHVSMGKVCSVQHKNMSVVFEKTGWNMNEFPHCVSCLQVALPTPPLYWGLMLATVCRGKTWPKHNHRLPSECPVPVKPALLVPSFVCMSKWGTCFSFLCLLLSNLHRSKVAKDSSLDPNPGVCRVSSVVLVGALAVSERVLANGAICRIISTYELRAQAVPFGRRKESRA